MGGRLSMVQVAVGVGVVLVGGCVTLPADLGRSDVEALLEARGQATDQAESSEAVAQMVQSLQAQPLTPASAVRIALINNSHLEATYAQLGFAAADVYEAGSISNPVFSGSLLDSNASGEIDQRTLGLAVSFTDLITLPSRKRLSAAAYVAAKQSIGAEVMAIAAETERAHHRYVGALLVAALREQVAKAGELSAALAERYRDAGNLTARELALERAASSEARLEALEAAAAAYEFRAELASIMGLSVAGHWTAPAGFMVPPASVGDLDTLLAVAHESRLDLKAAYSRVELLAKRRGVVNWMRWLGDIDIGAERERETDGTRLTGPTLDLEIPIFNQHRDDLLRADAELQIAVAEARQVSNDVDNRVRLAYAAIENTSARVLEFRDVLIPQRMAAVQRAQEEVNYMLIGIFELISLKQDEYDAYQGYLEAVRDYWLARANLSEAVGNSLPGSADTSDEVIGIEDLIRPSAAGKGHSGHGSPQDHGGRDAAPVDHSKHAEKPPDKTHDGATQ